MEFFEEWLKHDKTERNSGIFYYISEKFNMSDVSDDSLKRLKMKISSLSAKFNQKWTSLKCNKEMFLIKHKDWLEGSGIEIKMCVNQPCTSTSSAALSVGRPRKSFEDSSTKTKRRRVEDLLESRSASELITAAELATRKEGHRSVAKQIHNVAVSETREKNKCSEQSRQLTPDEALAYYVDSKSTSHSYKQTRKWSMKAGHQVYPSFYSLGKSKASCCPSDEYISVTESRAEIKLQAILDKTAERLVKAQTEVIRSVLPRSYYTLVSKWGCDGSSGHSTYKQKFENTNATDEFLFVYSFVPLRLLDGETVIWQNPRPSSTLYCRPIKFIFAKETKEFTKEETSKILDEVSQLLPTLCNVAGSQISVKHDLLLTMTDGKVCNALTDTSSTQKCYICGATPSTMNEESKKYPSNEERLAFGLSTLHAWIRTFECLLHISYRLEIKKWQVRGDNDKAIVKQRSQEIQKVFKDRMGLIVDKPKPGYGNTNDGNTARRFFSKAELSSEITGLDVNLIRRFHVILRTLSSGYDINYIEFEKFCVDTRKLYLDLYSWYSMPVTVHKILVHSAEVIKSFLLPIGQLSEEAQEARNKDCRRFRERHTRKRSRIATNTDLLRMLLITSDPVINSYRELPRRKFTSLPSEVLQLIIPPSLPSETPSVSHHHELNEEDYLLSEYSTEWESGDDDSSDGD